MKDSDLIYGIMASLGKECYSISLLKYLLEPFDISDSSLRTTLSRMQNRGIIKSEKSGKSALYSFTGKGKRIGSNVSFSFFDPDWKDWNNQWWGFLYSLPAADKSLRHTIRAKLSAYRFVSLYSGCWIRPLRKIEKIDEKLSGFIGSGYGHLVNMTFAVELSPEKVCQLWDLPSVINEFDRGLELISSSLEMLKNADAGEAFRLKMLTGNEIVQILFKDPLLPDCYLPENWKGSDLRRMFAIWEDSVSVKSKLYLNYET